MGRDETATTKEHAMASASRTTDHETIQRWVEARGGKPAHVKRGSSAGDPGILRIDYPGFSGGQSLEPLDWDAWFDAFEDNKLAFLYQDEQDSRFSKLVRRTGADEHEQAKPHQSGQRRKGKTTRVDLNSASEEELDALWGVGPVTARKIVEFRQREGHIASVDDLNRIDGIDGALVETLRREVAAA
jgi:competence ComEA-like helix-hairpin-helix protein